MRRCETCGARLAGTGWCSLCFTPVDPAERPATSPTGPADQRRYSRWRASSTSFGPWVKVPLTLLVILSAAAGAPLPRLGWIIDAIWRRAGGRRPS